MPVNKAFVYKSIPDGLPIKGKDLVVEPISEFDLAAHPHPNGLTIKNLYASYDPTQRGQMRDPSIKTYSQAFVPNDTVRAINVVAKVLKSNRGDIKANDILQLWEWPVEMFSFVEDKDIVLGRARKIQNVEGISLTAYVGVLGMSGMTAYGGFHELGRPKGGETILVSAASGAVGQIVGQIAVREGLTVIGSVGDDHKLEHIKGLGMLGFNYKREDLSEALNRLAPEGLDIYWDNVGGPLLDVALSKLKVFGRIIGCGSISDYNAKNGESYRLTNYEAVWKKRLAWQGMLISDPNIIQHQAARDRDIMQWLIEGSIAHQEHIVNDIDNAVDGFLDMLLGNHFGKSILKIQDF